MPIVTTCPYCRVGAVRGPDKAAGLSATCPKCKSSYTIVPDVGLPGWAKAETATPQATAQETHPHAAAIAVAEPPPMLSRKTSAEPAAPAFVHAAASVEVSRAAPGLAWALVAVTIFGLAVLASQFPFGRFVAPALAGIGMLIGLFGLTAEGRTQLIAAAGAALNFFTIGLIFLAPSWLGLDSWQPPTPSGPKTPQSVAHGSGVAVPVEWVNSSNSSWVEGDVRIAIRSTSVAPVELAGPNGATRTTKEPYLQILLRLTNDGVERRVELTGWAANGAGAELTDPTGKPLKVKQFEPGWELKGANRTTGLFPGKPVEVLLVFEPPPELLPRSKEPRPAYLRLQLPGAAVGVPDPAKFQIPGSHIAAGKVP